MKSARVASAVFALNVALLGAMGIPLPSEAVRLLAALGLPLPKSAVERELAEAAANLPHTAGSFPTAKRRLYEDVYDKHRQTFYCGCDFNEDTAGNPRGCGLRPRRDEARALRAEAGHVFPASQFGYYRRCWREPEQVCGEKISGRACCKRADPALRPTTISTISRRRRGQRRPVELPLGHDPGGEARIWGLQHRG